MSVAVAVGGSEVGLLTRSKDTIVETPRTSTSSYHAASMEMTVVPSTDVAAPEGAETEKNDKNQKQELEVVESNDEEELMPTPTQLPLSSSSVSSSSASSSPSISPSPSTTSDSSVASDTTHLDAISNKDFGKDNKAVEEENGEKNDDSTPTATTPTLDPGASADSLKYIDTSITTTSATALVSSTPPSSSTTSLPTTPPFSSSAPTSTSPSTTNINDVGIDSNGLLSLLRPRAGFNQNLNVKFAPLPELAPRKRKSATPLGMAARSQLARRRRMMYHDSYDDDGMYDDSYRPRRYGPPEVSEEGMEGGVDAVERHNLKKKAKKQKEGEDGEKKSKIKKVKKDGEQSEAEEDPFAVLAKKMGKAGRQIWRKMANGGRNEKESNGENINQPNVPSTILSGTTPVDPENPMPSSPPPAEPDKPNESPPEEVMQPSSEEKKENSEVQGTVLEESRQIEDVEDQGSTSPTTVPIATSIP